MSAGVVFSCALLGFAACSTYDDSLLMSSQGGAQSGGTGGAGASTGSGATGASPSGGVGTGGGAGSVGTGGSSPVVGGAGHSVSDPGAGGEGGADGGSSGSVGVGGSGGRASTGGTGGATANTGGVGGSSTTGGTGTTGGTSGIDMIDDFEAADNLHMQMILSNGRDGYWYPFHDATAAGVQKFLIIALAGSDSRAGSGFALHMTATGFTDYGAGFGADFVSGKTAPYDVSAYEGIRFYAKVAASSLTSLKLLIPTTYSDVMGGKCSDTVAMMHCSDHLFCQVNGLKTTWDVYECDFANLKQVGFGLKQTSFDPKSVYSVQFSFLAATTPADILVDDVAFVLK